MFVAWVWWCAVCVACACGVRGAAVDVGVAFAVNGTNTRNTDPSPRTKAVLLVVGGYAGGGSIADVELLDLEQGQWRTVAPLPSPRENAGLAVLNGSVYAVGGSDREQDVYDRSVYVYDIAANSWTAGPPLSDYHSQPGVAVIGSTIYVIGGNVGWVSTAEALDAGAASWRHITNTTLRCQGPCMTVIDGKLYSVHEYSFSTVKRYDPVTDTWERWHLRMGRQGRNGYSVGSVDGALYVIGGFSWGLAKLLTSVERFQTRPADPQSSFYRHGEWHNVSPMHIARQLAAVTTHRGKLYVVGGFDRSLNQLNTVEVFDPATDTWTLLNATMSVGRANAGAVVVEIPVQ